MNVWLFVLLLILVFGPKSTSEKAGRWDFRAVLLLLCVVGLVAQV